jgi:GDP-fucose transporter C1
VVDASFYQIARGLLLPFTLLLSFLVLGKKLKSFAPLSLVGAASVCVGFGIGMTTDLLTTNTSTIGLVLGVGSSFTTAVEAVVIKRFVSSNVQEKGDDMMQMAWMSNVLSTLLYSVLWLVFGRSTDVAAIAQSSSLLPTLCLAGVWGFLLTIATFLQISVTSPVTHMIVTAARGVAQSAFAVMLLPHESLGAGRLWSMGWILGGSALYGWAQDEAMTRAKQANATRLPLSHGEVTEKGQVVKGE